jgi:hypothetical protein
MRSRRRPVLAGWRRLLARPTVTDSSRPPAVCRERQLRASHLIDAISFLCNASYRCTIDPRLRWHKALATIVATANPWQYPAHSPQYTWLLRLRKAAQNNEDIAAMHQREECRRMRKALTIFPFRDLFGP